MNSTDICEIAETAVLNQMDQIINHKPTLITFYNALLGFIRKKNGNDYPGDFHFCDWITLFAAALEFKPTLVLELGRATGNSTMALAEASKFANFKLVSLSLEDWSEEFTYLKSLGIEPYLNNTALIQGDFRLFDFKNLIKDHDRILIFWDAHGFAVTEFILSSLMPLLKNKNHWVIMHDIFDVRYIGRESEAYAGRTLWTGDEYDITNQSTVRIGHIESYYAEGIGAYDFTARNHIKLETFRHHFECWKSNNFSEYSEFLKNMDGIFKEKQSYLAHFSLNDLNSTQNHTYPSPSKPLVELLSQPLAEHGIPSQITDIKITCDSNRSTFQLHVGNATLNIVLAKGASIVGGANGTNIITITGTQDAINKTLTTLTYQSNPNNYTGKDILTISKIDNKLIHKIDEIFIVLKPINITQKLELTNNESPVLHEKSHWTKYPKRMLRVLNDYMSR